MKTKTLLAVALACMTTISAPLTTEAKGILDGLIKLPKVGDIVQSVSSKHYNVSLDGTYYGASASKAAGCNNKDLIMTSSFYINKPTFVKFHGITNGYQASATYKIYDQDGYEVCSGFSISSNQTKDREIFLKPGNYNVKTFAGIFGANANLETRFKMEGESLNVTAANNTSVFSAQPLSIGVLTSNYFRSIATWSNDTSQHYYSIDVAYPYNLHIYAKKMREGSMSIVVLDEDERQLSSYMYCNDNIIDQNITLNPGRYYLRVKRESTTGAYYKLRID